MWRTLRAHNSLFPLAPGPRVLTGAICYPEDCGEVLPDRDCNTIK